MPRKRDEIWERYQLWLKLSKNKVLKPHHEASVAQACKTFDLDQKKDREALLSILAYIVFGAPPSVLTRALKGPKKTRPDRWTEQRQKRFDRDCKLAASRPPATASFGKIARRLLKPAQYGPFEEDYSEYSPETLEKYHRAGPGKQKKRNLERPL